MKHTDRQYPLPPTGVYTANWIPYGYRYDPGSPEMVIVDQEVAEAIRYLFRKYLSGMSLPEISHDLEAQGYPSPSRRKEQLGLPPRSGRSPDLEHWKSSALNQTVFHPMYAGDLIRSGRVWDAVYYYSGRPVPEGITLPDIEENHHEALISREDMKRASERYLLEREQRNASPPRRKRDKTGIPDKTADLSLGPVLHCGECGRLMDEIQMNIGGQPCTAYLCSGLSLLQPSKCTNRFYRQSEWMAPLLSAVEAERKQALRIRQQITGEGKNLQYSRTEKNLLREIDKAVDAVRKNMMETRRIQSRQKSGTLSEQEYAAESQRLQAEDDTYSRQVMDTLVRIREFRDICTPDHPWLALYAGLPEDGDYAADPERLLETVERIDLYPDQPPRITLAKAPEKEELLTLLKQNSSRKKRKSGMVRE